MFYLTIGIKLVAGLVSLFLVTRLVGKKSLSEFTPFDFVYALVLGGILEETLYDEQVTVLHLLFAVAIWGLLIYSMESLIQRAERLKTWIHGEPAVLIHDHRLNLGALKRNHIELEQLRGMLRQEGSFSLRRVRYAIMEVDGNVSVMIDDAGEDVFSYMVIDEGVIETGTLETLGKDAQWLRAELGRSDTENLVYAEWSAEEGFYLIDYDEVLDEKIRIES